MKQQVLTIKQPDVKNSDNPVTAVIYIRVSTDGQALKGYSQRSQEERLCKFCQINNIKIIQTVFEDHSAKTFNRPAWAQLMRSLNQDRQSTPSLLLFTRWDRFSRNTANAYYMITLLQKMGIEIQATDQPLDLSIPENKVLLAMYIVTAEVENERRALNVSQGLRRAQREGRWIGNAPIGYRKTYTSAGKKIIIPHEPEASMIREIFTSINKQTSIRSLHRASVQKGFKCGLSAFWNMLRNPVYCGKIRISSVNGTADDTVNGIHEKLIPLDLFNRVQSLLNAKKCPYRNQSQNELLLLHGVLYCPRCSKKLLASGSKGRSKRYYYYHCTSACGYRIRAEEINAQFLQGIDCLSSSKEYTELYREIIKNIFHERFHQKPIDQAYITKSIDKLIDRSVNGKELLLNGYIDSDDYTAIKSDCEIKINNLGEELHHAYLLKTKKGSDLIQIVNILNNLKSFYTDNNIELTLKRKLSSLLLKEKLVFDSADFGNNLNDITRIIYGLTSEKQSMELVRSKEPMVDDASEKATETTASTISSYLTDQVHDYLTEFAVITANVKTINVNRLASY